MLKDKNTQIFQYLQTSLTKIIIVELSLSGLATIVELLLFYQIFIDGIYILSKLRQFCTYFQDKLVSYKESYQVSIKSLRLQLLELLIKDQETQKIRE